MIKLIDRSTRVLVQGITGSQGSFHTELMQEYGTIIAAGVTPGKGGENINSIPVYDTITEAQINHQLDASIIFVPAKFTLDAALEAIEAGLNPVTIITEGVPVKDSIQIMAYAKQNDVTIIGPNCPGLIKPEECKLGIMPSQIFRKGNIGVVSRSGTLFYEIAAHITRTGLGQSMCIGLGGDPIVGIDFIDALKWFENDPETEAVALIGEIGGDAEEKAALYIADGKFSKPVAGYIAGRSAIPGKRMGHAGAIIQGASGTALSKISALRNVGVKVGDQPMDVARALKELVT
ncbi:MAG: succinate--CoA ligase subunit alpha [Deltaproteobacteria bacterium]|nr:succinate--CoA ligase subunit alpha [Deltaproteobacteria bacterium]